MSVDPNSLNMKKLTEFIRANLNMQNQGNLYTNFTHPEYKTTQVQFYVIAERDVDLGHRANYDTLYALGVFHLQQAVEKTAKGFMLGIGYTMDQLRSREISHKTHQLFINSFERIKDKGLEFSEIVNQKQQMIDYLSLLDKFKKDSNSDFSRITTGQINSLFNRIEGLRKREEFTKGEQNTCINFLIEACQNIEELKGKMTYDYAKRIIDPKFLLSYYSVQVSLLSLYTLSFITFPHEVFTRYPENPLEMRPSVVFEEYEKGLGVVDCLDRLLKNTLDVIYDFSMMDFTGFKTTIYEMCLAMGATK